jgi:hypothetical protein
MPVYCVPLSLLPLALLFLAVLVAVVPPRRGPAVAVAASSAPASSTLHCAARTHTMAALRMLALRHLVRPARASPRASSQRLWARVQDIRCHATHGAGLPASRQQTTHLSKPLRDLDCVIEESVTQSE